MQKGILANHVNHLTVTASHHRIALPNALPQTRGLAIDRDDTAQFVHTRSDWNFAHGQSLTYQNANACRPKDTGSSPHFQ